MITGSTVPQYFEYSVRRRPDHAAVEEPGKGTITYRELALLADQLRDRLKHLGVEPGDRVGMFMHKSIDAVASIYGIWKCGAAYVPVDASAPVQRGAYILNDCSVKAIVVEDSFAEALQEEIAQLGTPPPLIRVAEIGGGRGLRAALEWAQVCEPAPASQSETPAPDDLAYVLYTSGSTGKPKGVMLSHRNAASYVDWCSEVFEPNEDDRFSSHAPFHFDLSVLDLYVPIKHGATLILIGEEVGKDPGRLAPLIADTRISIWYSTPSVLSVLTQYGKLERYDYSALRLMLFAGEVFPVKHLRQLKALLPGPRYFNLYGPTETNVCTYCEIPDDIPAQRSEPFPIGVACSHYRTRVVDDDGQDVARGDEGELVANGAGMMQGYWNLPERTAQAFLIDSAGERWYRTGDVVVEEPNGDYRFMGRRDRMVKKRGYRIELGEIEAGLYKHPAIKEAAVIALPHESDGLRIIAFLSCQTAHPPSVIELKRFCAENLPLYMSPDRFFFHDTLPKTSTEKTDYQRLKEMV